MWYVCFEQLTIRKHIACRCALVFARTLLKTAISDMRATSQQDVSNPLASGLTHHT
jgi:hypothetical protein